MFSTPDQLLELEELGVWIPRCAVPVARRPDARQLAAPDGRRIPGQVVGRVGRSGSAEEIRIQPGPVAYQADWSVIATGMGPEKHTAYAVQWFAMALALGLYLYLGWHNAQEKRHGNGHQSA